MTQVRPHWGESHDLSIRNPLISPSMQMQPIWRRCVRIEVKVVIFSIRNPLISPSMRMQPIWRNWYHPQCKCNRYDAIDITLNAKVTDLTQSRRLENWVAKPKYPRPRQELDEAAAATAGTAAASLCAPATTAAAAAAASPVFEVFYTLNKLCFF